MDESLRSAIQFLEKEIKTCAALSLFLSKKRLQADARAGGKRVLNNPSFYEERVREARKLVYELRKPG